MASLTALVRGYSAKQDWRSALGYHLLVVGHARIGGEETAERRSRIGRIFSGASTPLNRGGGAVSERHQGSVGTQPPQSFAVRPEEDEEVVIRDGPPWRTVVGVVISVIVVGLVAVPLALALTSARSASPSGGKVTSGPARHRVLAALSATIDSGSFDMTYSDQPLTAPSSASSTNPCPTSSPQNSTCHPLGPAAGLAISGQGTIDTNPFAMVVSANVPGLGLVTTRANGTNVWEFGGANYGLAPGSSSEGPGSPLSGFSNLVEGTLGPRQGALGMMGLASPTGYLVLDQNAITSTNQTGTGVVDGVAVTEYQVTLSPAQQGNVPGATPQEAAAIGDALSVLQQQGYTGTTVKVSIDAAGYIRQTISVASFSDDVTQTSDTTFSNFGCAGKVLMPGESGPTSPPPGCVSPDKA